MKATPQVPTSTARWGIDRGLALLIGGVVALILVGLIAVPLLARQTPALAPETTPEGVVQRFYLAVYDGDWNTAYGFLSATARARLTMADLQQQLSYSSENSQIRTGQATISGASATVELTETSFYDGGLFGGGEYSNQKHVLLVREGDDWKIESGPFWLPEA